MTDMSVIKMIISVAVWRIYPSWVNDKFWAWEGLGHSGMFWARLSVDDFRLSSKLSLFFPELCSFRRVFLLPALLQNLAPNVLALGLLVSTMPWSSFWKLRSVTWHFLANSDYDHEYFLKISFPFSKQSRCYLPDSYGDLQAEQSSLVVVRQECRMETWLPGVGEIERRKTVDRRRV